MFDYSCHGSLSRARARFLTRCLLLVAALAARGQRGAAGDAQGLHFFDIPALPLAEALQRFTASTGHSGLYDSGLVAGRRSRGVAGHYTAESALRLMLGDSLAGALRLAGHATLAAVAAGGRPRRWRRGSATAAAAARFAATRMCARAATARRSACGSATAARCGACACWIPRVRPSATSC